MTFTKSNLTEAVYHSTRLKKSEAVEAIEDTLEIIKSALCSGEPVLISGFGKFEIKDKKSRKGRNPQTGNDLMLDGRRVITFKCSAALRKKINGLD
jgi:integration host factor subunit alpha